MSQPEDETSLRRIINVPARGLGTKSVEKFFEFRTINNYSIDESLDRIDEIGLPLRAANSFKDFADIIHKFRAESEEITVAVLLEKLIKRLDFEKYLDDGTPQGEARKENVKELLSVAKAYSEYGLSSFLEEVALVSDLDNLNTEQNSVT